MTFPLICCNDCFAKNGGHLSFAPFDDKEAILTIPIVLVIIKTLKIEGIILSGIIRIWPKEMTFLTFPPFSWPVAKGPPAGQQTFMAQTRRQFVDQQNNMASVQRNYPHEK